jgi:hypothetical protein
MQEAKLLHVQSTEPKYWKDLFTQYHPTHSTSETTFKAIVGASIQVLDKIWNKYILPHNEKSPVKYLPLHLLWAHSFLSVYSHNDIIISGLWGVSDTSFLSKIWPIIYFLHEILREVSFDNRFYPFVPISGPCAGATVVVDTTECEIHSTLNATYSGYKKKFTFKYEVGVQIASGKAVWAPVPGLLGPDADQDSFYYFGIYKHMERGEKFLGDGHYVGLPYSLIEKREEMTNEIREVRAIVEHFFARLKQFECLKSPWRHSLDKHFVVFNVCVQLTNIKLDFEPLHDRFNKYLNYEDVIKLQS